MKIIVLVMIAMTLCYPTRAQSDIYSFRIDSLGGGNSIDFSSFQGKKILIIPAASGDSARGQYEQIKQLNKQYGQRVAIVIIPTNSFGTENGADSTLFSFYNQDTTNRFPVTQKIAVTGSRRHPLFEWLAQSSQNGVADCPIGCPFQKYLIGSSGKIIGVFAGRVNIFDPSLLEAITSEAN